MAGEDDEMIRCKDCGEEFVLSANERRWFEGRGLQLPKRCVPCRQDKRERNERMEREGARR
jgi:hypothetical protein